MSLYNYKAVTEKGQIVTNSGVEELSRFILIKKLKKNGLMPIKVTQIQVNRKARKNKKK